MLESMRMWASCSSRGVSDEPRGWQHTGIGMAPLSLGLVHSSVDRQLICARQSRCAVTERADQALSVPRPSPAWIWYTLH